ncbi:MAG: hypothetical protein HFJ80_03305 [Clostridiales bacterium]|nr:hypothetical protein [Clostridiales bacterium]
MMTLKEVKQICHQLSLENTGESEEALCEEISCIVYYQDVIDCGDTVMVHRHIDIEYSFGDYYEIDEDTALFQYIGTLCPLPLLKEETEMVLYQNASESGPPR